MSAVLSIMAMSVCAGPDGVDFVRDVQPILSDRCYSCHGPDSNQRQADLRLDVAEGLLAIVVPGEPAKSTLLHRVTSADPDERMPPIDSGLRVSADEAATIEAWIAAGATWEDHWSFVTPSRTELPADSDWALGPIDRFVRSRLEQAGFAPAEEETPARLLRRMTLDLTGLPPTLEALDRFLADPTADAYEREVDLLLSSQAYGERMAWDWLDVARYADTNGYQHDATRTMWPWRDWVVRALNDNMPFDEFTVWQLAGDLLPEPTLEQRLATGFSRHHMINGEGGRIAEESRVEYVFDQIETVGTAWMGLTLNCARCHDHKFDPISQRDYYALFDFFNQTPVDGEGGNPSTPPTITMPHTDIEVMVMADRPERRETYVLDRGLYNKRGEVVQADVPGRLPGLPAGAAPNRLGLAQWLVDSSNPLTARVIVNREWQKFFGRGLVTTPDDFGIQGRRPTHPELLDWLALEFVDSGWDLKALHRMIVTSATYRQSGAHRAELAAIDPENALLGRGPRSRMPSWMIRDVALAASGLLVDEIGGPPVKPYQPAGIWSDATFGTITYEQDHGEDLYRRSLYTFWRRIQGPPVFFDSASRKYCEVTPKLTNTPLHALTTLNDTAYVEAARVLAQRVMLEGGDAPAPRLTLAFRLATARTPTPDELEILQSRLDWLRDRYTLAPDEAAALLSVGESARDESLDVVEHASYTGLCTLILNLDETLTK